MYPLIEAYASACLQDPEMLDDNEETGMLCDGSLHILLKQMKLMMSEWGAQAWPQAVETIRAKNPKCRERFSVPYAAKNPDILHEYKLAIEDARAMILDPPCKGVVRIFLEPVS